MHALYLSPSSTVNHDQRSMHVPEVYTITHSVPSSSRSIYSCQSRVLHPLRESILNSLMLEGVPHRFPRCSIFHITANPCRVICHVQSVHSSKLSLLRTLVIYFSPWIASWQNLRNQNSNHRNNSKGVKSGAVAPSLELFQTDEGQKKIPFRRWFNSHPILLLSFSVASTFELSEKYPPKSKIHNMGRDPFYISLRHYS